jgi:Domain of Unknown Function (DUF1206)
MVARQDRGRRAGLHSRKAPEPESPKAPQARQATRSAMPWLARAGLAARGVIYVLIGIIAVQIAFGSAGHQADRSGALHLVASTPLGKAALWLLVVGFAGMCLWRASQAIWGSPGEDGKKASKRAAAAARAVFYGVVTFGVLKYALGLGAPSSSDSQSKDLTATALHYPGGQVLVVIAGLAFVGGGGYLAWRAFKKKFLKHLDMGSASPATRRAVERIGQAGGIARGAVFATAGIFLVIAGIDASPDKAKGVDSALRALARTPAGPWLLVAVAAGLILFGVYSFCESRWREV